MNNTPSKSFLQENVCKKPNLNAKERKELLNSNPAQVIRGFSLATRQVYDYIVRVHAYNKRVCLSHARISQIVRKSRRQVIRVLKTLKEWGLINWYKPEMSWKWNLSNEYYVDPIVTDMKFRKGAGYWIWGLRVMPLVLLASNIALSKARLAEDVTSVNSIDKYQSVSESVNSLSITRVESRKKANYQIRYTKVKPGLTKQESRIMHIEQMKQKELIITAIKLTKIGLIHFTPYHMDAITEANQRLQTVPGKIDNPIGYMKKLCLDWHKQRNIPTDFSFADQMFNQYPDFRNLPVYEDDGKIHKLPVGQATALTADGKKIDPRDYGIDPEAQVQYQANQSRQSSFQGSPKEATVNRTSPHSVYAPYKQQPLPEENLDIAKRKAVEHFKEEWDTLPPFAKELVGIIEGTQRVTPLAANKVSVEKVEGVRSMAEILQSLDEMRSTPTAVQRQTPSPLLVTQLPYEADDAPFIESISNDDQIYEEIQHSIS